MDTFIARENIRHFRERLDTETDPSRRAQLHKLMIEEEEDKLGRDSEKLQEIDTLIAYGKQRVNNQQALVATMELDGRDTSLALNLLKLLGETLLVYENRRRAIFDRFDQSLL